MKFNRSLIAPMLAAGFVAAALPLAPAAAAEDTGGQLCTFSGTDNSLCESPGNAQIVATPPPVS